MAEMPSLPSKVSIGSTKATAIKAAKFAGWVVVSLILIGVASAVVDRFFNGAASNLRIKYLDALDKLATGTGATGERTSARLVATTAEGGSMIIPNTTENF